MHLNRLRMETVLCYTVQKDNRLFQRKEAEYVRKKNASHGDREL